jgi:hypothetical protein
LTCVIELGMVNERYRDVTATILMSNKPEVLSSRAMLPALPLPLREMASSAMRTSFSLLARETPRTCAVSAGEAKAVVMTALAIASSDNNRLSSIPSILMSNLAARFRWRTSAVEPAYSLVLGYVVHQDDLVHTLCSYFSSSIYEQSTRLPACSGWVSTLAVFKSEVHRSTSSLRSALLKLYRYAGFPPSFRMLLVLKPWLRSTRETAKESGGGSRFAQSAASSDAFPTKGSSSSVRSSRFLSSAWSVDADCCSLRVDAIAWTKSFEPVPLADDLCTRPRSETPRHHGISRVPGERPDHHVNCRSRLSAHARSLFSCPN